MITRAAVKLFDYKQNKEIIIPCHRHCDAFYILKAFGYAAGTDYKELAQGFLTDEDRFLNRIEAKKHAQVCGQLTETEYEELYSEDVW